MSITTGKVRASYANLFQPKPPMGGGEPKYSVSLLIPKTDAATLNAIYAEIELAKQAGAQKKFGGQVPSSLSLPLHDGDGQMPSGEMFGAECKGCMVLRTSSTNKPSVVDANLQPVLNPTDVYSGCYIRANVNFYAYNVNGHRGISCGINAVQKVEDGEPLVSRVTAEEAFGGTNAYAAAAPAAGLPAYHQGYNPAPTYQAPPAAPAGYGQPATPAYPPAGYGQPQIDPITGLPVVPGGVMGI